VSTIERTCEERIEENYKSRNEVISQMLVHHNGQFEEQLDELTEEFVEEFTKNENREPTEDEIAKFRENASSSEYDEYSLMEFPLAFKTTKCVKIELSWGGPSDYIEAFVDDGSVTKAIYHFADWFDHAQMVIHQKDPMFEFVELFIEAVES
jgi:hypothetical protein